MIRPRSCRFPCGTHTLLQCETNLRSTPFAFCLTEAQPTKRHQPEPAEGSQLTWAASALSFRQRLWAASLGGQSPFSVSHTFLEKKGVRFGTRGNLESEIAAFYNHSGKGWGRVRPASGHTEGEWKWGQENSGLPQTCTQPERAHWWQLGALNQHWDWTSPIDFNISQLDEDQY